MLAFDGAGIDGTWLTAVTRLAQDTPWLNGPVEAWTNYGLAVFALLMLAAWWRARRAEDVVMATALMAPVAVVAAFAVTEVVKSYVGELRPCRSLPHAYIVEACPAPSDYAFPSGHTTVAAATAAALFLVDRRLSVIAGIFALLEGFSRVYLGAHYPHDVIASFLVGCVVAGGVAIAGRSAGTRVVTSWRNGRLRPLLTTA
ncbi:phosphatase PAP2 family protein [Streptomyces sp. MAI_2237]